MHFTDAETELLKAELVRLKGKRKVSAQFLKKLYHTSGIKRYRPSVVNKMTRMRDALLEQARSKKVIPTPVVEKKPAIPEKKVIFDKDEKMYLKIPVVILEDGTVQLAL